MPRDGMIVRVAGVHKFFTRGSEQVDVLNDLNLNVPDGEFLALMGPSGSGKTTLLNLIAGLDRPSQGEVWVGGQLISKMSEAQLARWRTRHVGFVFQFYHLLPVMTAYENVELPLLLLPLTAAQRRRQVRTALDLVGLTNRDSHRPGQLSGGQQQRVGIARAIVTDPALIVADEPTGDLDAKSADEILDLLCELREAVEKTILLVTHDARAAQRAASRAALGQRAARCQRCRRRPCKAYRIHAQVRTLDRQESAAQRAAHFAHRAGHDGAGVRGDADLVVLHLLDTVMAEKTSDLKAIITERWQIPSQMPFAYADSLSQGAARTPATCVPTTP